MTFNNISLLKAAAGTATDNFANVFGYYNAGDGGGGDFYWDPTSVESDNGGTIFQVTGTTTGRWKRLYSGPVFFKWFGALANGSADDSTFLQNTINAFSGGNYLRQKNVVIESDPNAIYAIANPVFVPYNVSINFNNATIVPLTGGTIPANYMFYLNASLEGASLSGFAGNFPSFISNIYIDNRTNNISGVQVFYSMSKHLIENIRTENIQTLYRRQAHSGDGNDYNDQIHINRIVAQPNRSLTDTSVYIDINWLGDNLKIEDLDLHGATVHVAYCMGGVLDRLINTNLKIANCYGLSISNLHIEIGNISIMNSIIKLSNAFHIYQGAIPLTVTSDTDLYGSMANKSCIIENYNIVYYEGRTQLSTTAYLDDVFDAYINCNAVITNFFRVSTYGIIPYMTATAVRITQDGTTSFDDFNSCAANSISSIIVNKKITSTNQSINNDILGSIFVDASGRAFNGPPATYYYKAVVMLGDKRCCLATYTGMDEKNLAVTTIAPRIYNPAVRGGRSATVRLYRGTAPGNYTYAVDIPFTAFDNIIDYGFFINTGHYWHKRDTPGAIDLFNTASTASTFTQNADGTKVVKLAAAPTYGTWMVGDRIEKLAPDATNIGWICTSISPLTFLPI